jgi:anti-sigma factor RsiW
MSSMNGHVTAQKLAGFRQGNLSAEEVMAVGNHVARCAECMRLASEDLDLDASVRALHASLGSGTAEHPELESDLFALVDGSLPEEERRRIESHLQTCDRCGDDVDDLRRVAETLVPRRPRTRYLWFGAAAAAVLLVAIASASFVSRPIALKPLAVRRATAPLVVASSIDAIATVPAPPPARPIATTLGKKEWDDLVADAKRNGRMKMPRSLREVRAAREMLRGLTEKHSAELQPVGVVVPTDTPTFAWPAGKGAESVVMIYADRDEIANSGPVHATHWTPALPLPRGVTLTWQVEIRRAGTSVLIPEPPDPPALFSIARKSDLKDLAEAKKKHPENMLLHGLLNARAGLKDEAVKDLRRHSAKYPESKSLLHSIEGWR